MTKQQQARALKKFAQWALNGYFDGETGDIDGASLEEKALELGLLAASGNADDPNYYVPKWLAPRLGTGRS